MAGVAAAGADGGVTGHAHRIGRKARRRIGMAVAALDPVTGICGGVFMPVAVVPLWQLEQLVSVAAWVYLPPAQLAKAEAALVWQVTQSLPLVAT